LLRDGKVLLMRRARDPWRDAWEVPGGFCEPAEHPRDAAVRELREELGISARAVAYLGAWIDRYGPADPVGTLNCAYLLVARDADPPLRLQPEEVLEAAWFDLSAPPSPLAFPGHMGRLLAAAARIDPAAPPPMFDAQ
jgi:8-oxo-dGTP diphosphatase